MIVFQKEISTTNFTLGMQSIFSISIFAEVHYQLYNFTSRRHLWSFLRITHSLFVLQLNLNQMTFKRQPLPCISVKLKVLAPEMLFKIFFVVWDICGFFVSAATAADKRSLAIWRPGFINFRPAVCVHSKTFCDFFLNPAPLSWNFLGVKVICFWHLRLAFEQISCTLRKTHLLFKSDHADINIGEQFLVLHFQFYSNFWPLVCSFIYLLKTCYLHRPPTSHFR